MAVQAHVPPNSHLVFHDEFDGTEINWNLWTIDDVRTLSDNGEQQFYIDPRTDDLGVNPFSLNDGVLTIEAAPASDDVRDRTGLDYTSGKLQTSGIFETTYGYYEIRAELPGGQGLWPAFWLTGVNSWPPEIDIVEAFGNQPNEIHTAVHTGDYGGDSGWGGWQPVGADITDGFHTYGVDWQADEITFYFDGEPLVSTEPFGDSGEPMFILVNLAVGGDWPGLPDESTPFPAEMKVDYVRVYQDGPGESPPDLPEAPDTPTDGGGEPTDGGSEPTDGGSEPPAGNDSLHLTVTASGDHYHESPRMQVYVDDQLAGEVKVKTQHSEGEWNNYTFALDDIADPQSVKVAFVNDAYERGVGDRNLWIKGIEVNDQEIAVDEAIYHTGHGDLPGRSGMMWQGELVFDVSGYLGANDTLIS